MNPTKPVSAGATETGAAPQGDSLSITDNRTGKKYDVPISHGTIRAMDLRQIKVEGHDFGVMNYDPAFLNTAACISKVTFIDGDQGILRYRGYSIEELAEKSTYIETAYLILMASCQAGRNWKIGSITSRITHSSTKASRNFWTGFTTTPTPWGC